MTAVGRPNYDYMNLRKLLCVKNTNEIWYWKPIIYDMIGKVFFSLIEKMRSAETNCEKCTDNNI